MDCKVVKFVAIVAFASVCVRQDEISVINRYSILGKRKSRLRLPRGGGDCVIRNSRNGEGAT